MPFVEEVEARRFEVLEERVWKTIFSDGMTAEILC